MSIGSPTTTSSSSSNLLTSFIHSIRNKRSMSPIVQRLLELCVHYQQQQQNNQNNITSNINMADSNQSANKKIKSLIKKLPKTKRNSSLEELEKAILHKDSRTKCVTIPRSHDNQDQSSRSNPVVDYCRLWRWPDLSNQNELKPVDYCPNAFHYILDDICINPFHYERIPATYSVYVPHLPPTVIHNMPDLRSSSINDIIPNQIPQNTIYQTPIEQQSPPSFSPESINSQDSFLSSCGGVSNDENFDHTTPMELDIVEAMSSNSQQGQTISGERVSFEESHEWCHISYYEMANRIGEQFRATQAQVIIDGYTHPSNAERFCLGGLTNVQRTMDIDKARRYIGRGVKLFHIRGNVFAECLSDNPVFVQSPITNKRFSWHPATVCKIPPNVRLKIFDSHEFTQILTCALHEGYESVYSLMRMCILRMSFVKGWGVDYPRQTVTSTPCWIEIHLDGPLKWLDTVLSTMRGPTQSITSVS